MPCSSARSSSVRLSRQARPHVERCGDLRHLHVPSRSACRGRRHRCRGSRRAAARVASRGFGADACLSGCPCGRGFARRPGRRPTDHTPSQRPPPPVRGRCVQRGHGLLAHAAAGGQGPGPARRPGWSLRAQFRGTHGVVHRWQIRPGRLRPARDDHAPVGRPGVRLRGDPRRCPAGVRILPHGAERARGVHLHQLRRPGHTHAGQALCPAGRCHDRQPAVRERQPRLAGRR
jgi:hypothetical protein